MDCIKRKFIPVFILYVTLLVMTNTLFNLFPTVLVYLLTAYSDQFNLLFILVIILFYLNYSIQKTRPSWSVCGM